MEARKMSMETILHQPNQEEIREDDFWCFQQPGSGMEHKCAFSEDLLIHPQWCSGRALNSHTEDPGFNPQPSQEKVVTLFCTQIHGLSNL